MSSGYALSPSFTTVRAQNNAEFSQLLLAGLLAGLSLHLFSSWPQRTASSQFDAMA